MKTVTEIKILNDQISNTINEDALVFSKFTGDYFKTHSSHFDQPFVALAEVLKTTPSLTILDLSRGPFEGRRPSIEILAEALKINTSLTILNLSGNHLHNKGIEIFAKALKENRVLTSLSLSRNIFKPYNPDENNKDKKLGVLSFDASSFGQAIKALAELIGTSNSLTSLQLDSTGLNSEGACILTNALINNTSLTFLNLSNNLIGALNHTTHSADINKPIPQRYWQIAFDSNTKLFHTLRELFEKNTTLVYLDLSANRIDPKHFVSLANDLLRNKTLTALKLDDNLSVVSNKVKAFEKLLQSNKTLTYLELGQFSRKIARSLQQNNRLERRMRLNWSQIAVAKRFIMANNENALRYSIFPLLLEIVKLAEIRTIEIPDDIRVPLIDIDKYSKTRHFEHCSSITPAFNLKARANESTLNPWARIDEEIEDERKKNTLEVDRETKNKSCSIQ